MARYLHANTRDCVTLSSQSGELAFVACRVRFRGNRSAVLILLNLLSGVALLVWGSHIVRTGILRVLGADLRAILGRSTGSRLRAFLAGVGVTSLVQSSNATAVIITSFAAQGLVPLGAGLTVLLGADVGTALMARVLTLDLSWLSPLLILFGVPLFLTRKQDRAGQAGRTIIGLGLILLALHLIVEAAQPMMQGAGVRVMFGALTGDTVLDALVGAGFAMISYSSLAAVLLTATLASSGVISLKVALCLVVGANLGSGLLALLNALPQNAAARRLSGGSFLFKLAGAVVILPFASLLASGLPLLISNPREAVVGFHVIYNLVRCCACLSLVDRVAALSRRVLPDRPVAGGELRPMYLDAAGLVTPSLALANASREVLRIGDIVRAMLDNVARPCEWTTMSINSTRRSRATSR
jgi:phosphate:Na+ symporter